MIEKRHSKRAVLIAALLEGAWRSPSQSVSLSANELEEITPLLLGSGTGALAWWRIRETHLHQALVAPELHQSYRLHAINASLYHHKIKLAFHLLRSNGIEPILIKGWANARLYPEAGLRPYGDIDLCVEPSLYARAESVLSSPEGETCWVDLHSGIGHLDNRSWDELYKRSQLVRLDETDVRVLGAEDHLSILCLHLLNHGAWRPIWLCDVAINAEAIPANFDWDICFGKDKRRAKWISSAIKLAYEFLDARIEHCPLEVRNARLPRWFVPTVLQQWERPGVKEHYPPELIMRSLRNPVRIPQAIYNRWPNPIEATIRINGSFNELPRLPFQVSDYLIQTAKFLTRLPGLLRENQ